MESKELNRKLVDALPDLKQRYQDEVEWQDGDDTGSHVVFGDVLAPVMETLLEHADYALAHKYFDFLEALLALKDAYVDEVVAVSVIEYLYFSDLDRMAVKVQLGDRCRAIWEDFERYYDRQRGTAEG